jgi:hypothetical protein
MYQFFIISILLLFKILSHEPKNVAHPAKIPGIYAPGVDVLGLAKQNVPMIARHWKTGFGIGVLEGTFGHVIPPLKTMLSTKKVAWWRAHIMDGSCGRLNHPCEPGAIKLNDTGRFRKRVQKFQKVFEAYPEYPCYLSPALEHDITNKKLVDKWVSIIQNYAPACKVVVSVYRGYTPRGVLIEKHGNTPRNADFTSNDGASLFDADIKVYKTVARVHTLGWVPSCNLRDDNPHIWAPPSLRTRKMTAPELERIFRILS